MLEITLMKSLYHEMNEDNIKEVETFTNNDASKFHKLAMKLPEYPELESITVEVHYMAYGSAMYYLHMNDNLEVNEDINQPMAKAAILHFFRTYQPSFIKPDLPEDLSEISILNCFQVEEIPDYRPKYAFPGLILYEDMKNGTIKTADGSAPSFPGLRILNQEKPEDDRPAYVSSNETYTKFDGNQDDFQKKMEELKAKFQITP